MIYHVWGLKQLWIQVNGHAWLCLLGLHRRETSEKFNMSSPDIEPGTLWFLAGHLDRLAIASVDYMCFKLLQYSEVTGNAWGISKHVAIQLIKVLKFKYKQ